MAFSTALNTIRVYGTLGVYGVETATSESADGVQGTITFRPSGPLTDVAANQVLFPDEAAVTVTLGPADNGAFSVRLAATDDPQFTPSGWTWTATENFGNAQGEATFSFNLPAASPGAEVKYASIRPGVTPSAGGSSYILLSERGVANGVASLDATTRVPVAQLGTGSAGAGLLFLADDRTFKSPGVGGGGDPTLSGDVTGLGSANTIAADKVTTSKILNGAVTTAKIGDSQVTSAKLADATIVDADVSGTAAIAETKLSLNSDAAAGVSSRRSLGTGATQAAAGNHAHSTLAVKTETIRSFDHGTNAAAARPTGYDAVYWRGSVLPDNLAAGDFWNDPALVSEYEAFIDLVQNDNPFSGTPAASSMVVWDVGGTRWTAGGSTTDTSGEAILYNGGFGPVWARRDTRRQVTIRSCGLAADQWSAMPSAKTELYGAALHRARMDLRSSTQVRVSATVAVAGFAGSTFRAEYSVNSGGAWAYLTQAAGTSGGTTPSVSIASTGDNAGAWAAIHADAQVDTCLVRVVGVGGNGAITPSFGNIYIETR